MSFAKIVAAASLTLSVAMPAFAQEILIHDAYMRSSGAMARSGAAFMHIMNETDQDDRLIAATSDVAKLVELHTHIETAEGVMQMREDEDGFEIPAGEYHALVRGGDHVMFMGLTRTIEHGDIVTVTLTFEKAGDITVEIPVDLERQPGQGMMHNGMGPAKMGADSNS